MKELWIEAYEQFIEENGREPTDDEMDIAFADYIGSIADSKPD